MRRVISIGLLAGCLFVIGCTGDRYDDEYPPDGAYVERGWYYDPDYYDVYHVYHPRCYWYYDGRHYVRHDDFPHGEEGHLRVRDFGHGPIGGRAVAHEPGGHGPADGPTPVGEHGPVGGGGGGGAGGGGHGGPIGGGGHR